MKFKIGTPWNKVCKQLLLDPIHNMDHEHNEHSYHNVICMG